MADAYFAEGIEEIRQKGMSPSGRDTFTRSLWYISEAVRILEEAGSKEAVRVRALESRVKEMLAADDEYKEKHGTA
jgi:hypothetical protein